MEGVQRDERVVICGELFPRPDIPPCGITFWGMAQTIYRKLRWVESFADADLEAVVGQETRSAKL
jgi:hypothetical protein